ncbi:hypothetical protein DFP73DRAFT_613353 [Morchella snyderi]|nr:hypothetical protein DFP73DRAFT_613353 [Morchella snyderi]
MAGYADTDDPQPNIGGQSGMHDKDMVKDLGVFQGREQGALIMRCATSRADYYGSTLGRIDVFTEAGSSVDRQRGRIVHKESQPCSGTSVAKPEQSFIDGPEAGCVTSRCSQYLPKGNTFAITAVVFLSLIPTARASDDGDDFANNLFSDLAPILALFGEQVTKQFLSESSGWADNILFAMAPLGVITGVVSAIRVAGHPWLKALVGRGKEGLAQAELELMSSNSPDVGEMWNGQAVIRVLGKPSIFQFVYTPDTVVPDSVSPLQVPSSPQAQGSAEPHSTPSAALAASDASSESAVVSELGLTPNIDILSDNNIFFGRQGVKAAVEVQDERRHEWHESIDVEMRPLLRLAADAHNLHEGISEKNPPNISLNARGQRISDFEKWLITIVGSTAQLVVLFFEYLISHHPRLRLRFLKGGSNPSPQAFPCAVLGTVCLSLGMLVCSYVVDCASTEETWVLRNKVSNCRVAWVQRGGTVNDQEFAPYLIFGHKDQREIITSHRCQPRSQLKLRVWVLVATCATIVGFVTQFLGLRGMHWSASVAQLAATAFVTALRSFTRRRMTKEPTVSGAVKGYELDSMARKLNDCLGWKVIYEIPTSVLAEQRDNLVDKVLFTRKHLEHLSGWSADVQEVADAVCTSMERTLNYIYESRDIHLDGESRYRSIKRTSSKSFPRPKCTGATTSFRWYI